MDYLFNGLFLVLCITCLQSTASLPPALLLSPYIHENRTAEARTASSVNSSLFLNVTSYSGFLTVDPVYNSNTFFWYFPVAGKPVNETPWIIWLQGGPGGSSLVGVFDEIGPFQYDGTLSRRQYDWSENHSLLFIDNPVGAGFSFTDDDRGFVTDSAKYSGHLLSALQQFLTIFPELRKAPLYIAGESYAGRYVPGLATLIMEQKPTEEWEINLQGLILGNPVFSRDDIANLTAIYFQWGLVDSQGVLAAKPLQDGYSNAIKDGKSDLAYEYRNKLLDKLMDISSQSQSYNALADHYDFEEFEEFLARDDVKTALHVGDIKFSFRNETVTQKLIPDFLNDADTKVQHLLDHYKVLVYCGQLDLTAPCVPNSETRRRKWQWNKKEMFLNAPRVPWWHNETVAGYVKSGGGFTEALVRGAGHLVPIEKPAQALDLVATFIGDKEINIPPKYEVKLENTPHLTSQDKGDVNNNTVIKDTTDKNTDSVNTSQKANTTIKDVTTEGSIKINSTLSTQSSALPFNNIANNGIDAGIIASVIINVILIMILIVGAFLYYRLKKRSEDFFYNNVDNNSDDLFLT